jgi:hypothetical protein
MLKSVYTFLKANEALLKGISGQASLLAILETLVQQRNGLAMHPANYLASFPKTSKSPCKKQHGCWLEGYATAMQTRWQTFFGQRFYAVCY